jgi:hypothetical protein
MQPLTIIVTSCDRFDLLERTLDSFFALNTYPYVAFHIHNDSLNSVPLCVKQKYSDKGITWHEGVKRGLSASWDYLVGLVETEYFFNLEDDWEFQGNANFIQESINVLNESFEQVWIRGLKDHLHGLSHISYCLVDFEGQNHTHYKKVNKIKDWCGFTFNPSVRQLSTWKRLFPKGISGMDEIDISRMVYNNYQAASLVNSACKHIGWNRHTNNFKI